MGTARILAALTFFLFAAMQPETARAQTPTPTATPMPPGGLMPPDPATLNQSHPIARFFYLVPFNRDPIPEWELRYRLYVETARDFYTEQMDRNGFTPKTFNYEVKPDGVTPMIHLIDLKDSGFPEAARYTDSWFHDVAGAWGGGLPVGAFRLNRDWDEGSGIGLPPDAMGSQSALPGATWNSPDDPNTDNINPETSSAIWDLDNFNMMPVIDAANPSDTIWMTTGATQSIWNVSTDVQQVIDSAPSDDNYGWMIRRLDDGQSGGHAHYFTRESSRPPRLTLHFQGVSEPAMLIATADTYLKSSSPNWNQGAEETMQLRKSTNQLIAAQFHYHFVPLVRFSTAEIRQAAVTAGGAPVTWALLSLDVESALTQNFSRPRAEELIQRYGFRKGEGEVWTVVFEAGMMNEINRQERPGNLGSGTLEGDEGLATLGSNLAFWDPAWIWDDTTVATPSTQLPGVINHGLVPSQWLGLSLRRLSRDTLGSFLHENQHAWGLWHDTLNDQETRGNLMGLGRSGIHGYLSPECYPDVWCRLSYNNARTLDTARVFNPIPIGDSYDDNELPEVDVISGGFNSDTGLMEFEIHATDPSGLTVAHLFHDGRDSQVGFLESPGETDASFALRTSFFNVVDPVLPTPTALPQNRFTIFVRDTRGNTTKIVHPNISPMIDPQLKAPEPALVVRPAEIEDGGIIQLVASVAPLTAQPDISWEFDWQSDEITNDFGDAVISPQILDTDDYDAPEVRRIAFRAEQERSGLAAAVSDSNPIAFRVTTANEHPPLVHIQFGITEQVVFEDDSLGGILITAMLTDEDCSSRIDANFMAVPSGSNPAAHPDDFTLNSGTLVFLPGQKFASAVIPIVDDVVDEFPETFDVILTGVTTSSGASVGSPSVQTVTIVDPFCCPGDANHDRVVDGDDFLTVMAHFGSPVSRGEIGDANCSGGLVNGPDFIAVQANIGDSCLVLAPPMPTLTPPVPPTASPTPVPFPTPTPTPCPPDACSPGDANNSGGFIDSVDFIAVQANFGEDNGPGGLGDADCMGVFVDSADFISVQSNFGDPSCEGASGFSALTTRAQVMEPASGVPRLHTALPRRVARVGERLVLPVLLDINDAVVRMAGSFIAYDPATLLFLGGSIDPGWSDLVTRANPRQPQPGMIALNAGAVVPPAVHHEHADLLLTGTEEGEVETDGFNIPVARLEFLVLAPDVTVVSFIHEPGRETMTIDSNLDVNPMIALEDTVIVTHAVPPGTGDLAAWIALQPDDAFKHPGANRRNTLLNKIDAVTELIADEEYQEAIDELTNDLRKKADGHFGGNPNNDWVTDPVAQRELILLIDALVRDLELNL